MALVEIKELEKSFHNRKTGDVQILRGIDLSLDASQTICVVGESGCGKTTLGKILAGLQSYSAGSFRYNGKEVAKLHKKEWKNVPHHVQ